MNVIVSATLEPAVRLLEQRVVLKIATLSAEYSAHMLLDGRSGGFLSDIDNLLWRKGIVRFGLLVIEFLLQCTRSFMDLRQIDGRLNRALVCLIDRRN